MIREALQYIVGLNKPEVFSFEGRTYVDKKVNAVEEEIADAITVKTLSGLVDYIKFNIDNLDMLKHIVLIKSHTEVVLISTLNKDKNRNCFVSCVADLPNVRLNNFIDTESFNIMLQSCFVKNEDRDVVLKVVGNIKEEAVKTVGDDGISQSVVAKTGIAKHENVLVPNPVILAPYRTFTEIEQPESAFVFRMQDGPRAALFEADGGSWRNKAMIRIKYYLDIELNKFGIQVIA